MIAHIKQSASACDHAAQRETAVVSSTALKSTTSLLSLSLVTGPVVPMITFSDDLSELHVGNLKQIEDPTDRVAKL